MIFPVQYQRGSREPDRVRPIVVPCEEGIRPFFRFDETSMRAARQFPLPIREVDVNPAFHVWFFVDFRLRA